MRIGRRSVLAVAGMTVALATTTGAVVAKDTELTLVEHATTDAVIDVGEAGDTIGDMLAFGNDLYDAEDATVVGRDQGQCFRSNPGMSWECVWTNILEEGSITVQGAFYDDLRDAEFAITGGTGAYADAGGTMTLHSLDEAGAKLEFSFHVSAPDNG